MWALFTMKAGHMVLAGLFNHVKDAEAFREERGGQVRPMGDYTFPVFLLRQGDAYLAMDRAALEHHLDALRVQHVIAVAGVSSPDPVQVFTFQKPWQSPEPTDCLPQLDHAHVDGEFIRLMEDEGSTEFAFGPLS